jgi:hypothetical protein
MQDSKIQKQLKPGTKSKFLKSKEKDLVVPLGETCFPIPKIQKIIAIDPEVIKVSNDASFLIGKSVVSATQVNCLLKIIGAFYRLYSGRGL